MRSIPMKRTACGAAMLLIMACPVRAQIMHWTFDDPNSPDILSNSGSAGGVFDLVGYRSDGNRTGKANIQSSPGVGGKGLALDLTSTPSMGAPQGANAATISGSDLADNDVSKTWSAMTITGWYKAAGEPTASIVLLRHSPGANVGWTLKFQGPEQLLLSVGKANLKSDAAYTGGSDSWQFFAVTWTSEAEVKWYVGTENSAIEPAGVVPGGVEMSGGGGAGFGVGRANSGGGSFRGFLDDIRIYDKELSAEEIEAIRKSATP